MAIIDERLSFGAQLRQRRLGANLTQEALAERAGLSVRAIQHLEADRGRPNRHTARRLAEALHLTGELVDEFEAAGAPTPRRRTRPRSTRRRAAVLRLSLRWLARLSHAAAMAGPKSASYAPTLLIGLGVLVMVSAAATCTVIVTSGGTAMERTVLADESAAGHKQTTRALMHGENEMSSRAGPAGTDLAPSINSNVLWLPEPDLGPAPSATDGHSADSHVGQATDSSMSPEIADVPMEPSSGTVVENPESEELAAQEPESEPADAGGIGSPDTVSLLPLQTWMAPVAPPRAVTPPARVVEEPPADEPPAAATEAAIAAVRLAAEASDAALATGRERAVVAANEGRSLRPNPAEAVAQQALSEFYAYTEREWSVRGYVSAEAMRRELGNSQSNWLEQTQALAGPRSPNVITGGTEP